MSKENVEIVRAAFEAWNRGDRDAWMDAFDERAELLPLRSPLRASLKPTGLDFGSVPVGEGSVAQQYTVTSIASEAITLDTTRPGGANPTEFLPDDACSGTTLQPGAACSVPIVFAPQDVGERTAFYTLTDPGNGQTRQVAVRGTGTPPSTSDGTEDGTSVPPPEGG